MKWLNGISMTANSEKRNNKIILDFVFKIMFINFAHPN